MTQNTNPFVLPGFGQTGDMASNPMLASMEMMRKAWEGLASASGFDASQAVPGTSPEDLDRRISDLRAVENWLRMNLSMLGSTIQALEVQRSTLATLQAFVASAGGVQQSDATPSPLDAVLGIRRGADVAPSADTSGLFGASAKAAPSGQPAADDAAKAKKTETDQTVQADAAESSVPGAEAAAMATEATSAVMKSWWDMLQTQFDNLASATAAGIQSAEAMKEAASTAGKAAKKATKKTAARKAAKKTAAKKTAAKKTAAKKAAAKKTTARKTASAATVASTTAPVARPPAAKKTAAKKTAKTTKTAGATPGVARKS